MLLQGISSLTLPKPYSYRQNIAPSIVAPAPPDSNFEPGSGLVDDHNIAPFDVAFQNLNLGSGAARAEYESPAPAQWAGVAA